MDKIQFLSIYSLYHYFSSVSRAKNGFIALEQVFGTPTLNRTGNLILEELGYIHLTIGAFVKILQHLHSFVKWFVLDNHTIPRL